MRVILDKNLNAQQFLYEGEKLLASAAWADALEAFSAALRIDPQCFIARLQCGYCHEQLQHIDTAAIEYLRALEQAQATGVWLNPQTTPIEQRALVEHAVRAVRNLRHQSLLNLLEPLRREHGSNALQRVERCIRIYLRLERQNPSDIRQKPSFLYFPDITNSPYYDTDQFTWKHDLEAATDQIRSELVKALAMDSGHEAVFTSTALEAQNLRSLNFKPNWNGY
jgi:aspartate beta-hydroxylase